MMRSAMTRCVVLALFLASAAGEARAQVHGTQGSHAASTHHEAHAAHMRLMVGPLSLPRNRTGSGTAWLPDASPMYGLMGGIGDGGYMFHYNVAAGYDWFSGPRGSERFVSTNWAMLMVWHPVGPGELMGRFMLSAEPLTAGGIGYPLLLQTGETWQGQLLHDRQHPHDFFMELGASYTVPLGDEIALQLYGAVAGEPALGPTAFPHRISAISDPLAPIGHHWIDSTHVSFGVLTAGVFTKDIKLEASWFNGREPDEDRWDLDLRAPDSFSTRLTVNPSRSWSLQWSYGYLKSPEPHHPGVSTQRVTASALHNWRIGRGGNWASAFVMGRNTEGDSASTYAFLVESNLEIDTHHGFFGRAEYVRKPGHDLILPEALEEANYNVGLMSVGYIFRFSPIATVVPGLGVRGTVALVPEELKPVYGQDTPVGVMVFLHLRPQMMGM